jgi:hypothetical protein
LAQTDAVLPCDKISPKMISYIVIQSSGIVRNHVYHGPRSKTEIDPNSFAREHVSSIYRDVYAHSRFN